MFTIPSLVIATNDSSAPFGWRQIVHEEQFLRAETNHDVNNRTLRSIAGLSNGHLYRASHGLHL